MSVFEVKVREVHYSYIEVEADNEDEAIRLVADGDGQEVDNEYGYVLDDPESWEVVQLEDDEWHA